MPGYACPAIFTHIHALGETADNTSAIRWCCRTMAIAIALAPVMTNPSGIVTPAAVQTTAEAMGHLALNRFSSVRGATAPSQSSMWTTTSVTVRTVRMRTASLQLLVSKGFFFFPTWELSNAETAARNIRTAWTHYVERPKAETQQKQCASGRGSDPLTQASMAESFNGDPKKSFFCGSGLCLACAPWTGVTLST